MTADEMRSDSNWCSAWYCAESPSNDFRSEPEGALLNVVEVIAAVEGEHDASDWLCVCKMADGQFATMRAGCDYTGWDCRAGGRVEFFPSLEEATSINALTEDERKRLEGQI